MVDVDLLETSAEHRPAHLIDYVGSTVQIRIGASVIGQFVPQRGASRNCIYCQQCAFSRFSDRGFLCRFIDCHGCYFEEKQEEAPMFSFADDAPDRLCFPLVLERSVLDESGYKRFKDSLARLNQGDRGIHVALSQSGLI